MSVIVDILKCTGCGACTRVCPQNAIRVPDNLAVVDKDLCVECGRCVPACPSGAISLPSPARLTAVKNSDRTYGYGRIPVFRGSHLARPYTGRARVGITRHRHSRLRRSGRPHPASPAPTRRDELKALKEQSEQARRRLAELEARIRRLSNKY
jgi:Fe-S-cluster-containing hydrogenase component 2